MTNLLEIYSEWQNNPEFREAFKQNPEQALKHAGFELTPGDMDKIKTIFKVASEELEKRENK